MNSRYSMYVTTEKDLLALCEELKGASVLAIDTEFVRERTYFHRLGLIQVMGNGVCAAIDPIEVKDISPFLEILRPADVLKVFHAGKQDLEILYHLLGGVVRPVFDTQVAASFVGWGAQISFAKIVKKVTSKVIHKTETYSDWCRRPLSESQIEYAIDDVRYLMPVYEKLNSHLKKMGRLEWVQEEVESLMDPANYELPDPERQFLRIKSFRSLKGKHLMVLKSLAAWREREALRRDCLPKFIVRDEPLLEMARKLPKDIKQLSHVRGFHPKELSQSGAQILEAIKDGLKRTDQELPEIPETRSYTTQRGIEELLAAFVQIRSEEVKVEPHVLADRRQIHDLVRRFEQGENLESQSLLVGWREDFIGRDLLGILEGQIGLSVNRKGKVTLIPMESKTPSA